MQRILVVEDEKPIREMIGFNVRRAGYELIEAADGQEAELAIVKQSPDLILMDWMLPDVSGIELIRRFKRDELTGNIPIIMLTARSNEDDKIHGLDSGADDYVTKPFSPKELLARIRASLRRQDEGEGRETLTAGKLSLDVASHRVSVDAESVDIGPTEFRLLHFFMQHADRVYSRSQLLDHVWGRNAYVEDRTVDVHILRLRKLLEPYDCAKLIQTVRGSGYRFSLK